MISVVISANTSWYLFNFRKNTISTLINNGYHVIVLAPFDEYSDKLKQLGAEFVNIDIDQGGTNPIHDFKTFLSFYKFYSSRNVNVVLNFTPKNNIYSTFAAALCGIKIINNIAGLGFVFVNEGLISKIARLLYKHSQRRASKIFFQNEDDRDLFIQSDFVARSITDRLPGSGVDLSRFTVIEAPDDGVVRFILIARMLYDKGITQYIESARMLKRKYGNNIEFYLLGFLDVNNPSAVSESEMQAWVDEGIVKYLGVSDCVEQEIGKIDCVVLPSFYREGVPKSLLEAGAMGKPIITTDNVGCRDTVDHGVNGFLCEPRSSQSLMEMLDKVICMTHQQRLSMGLRSRHKMESEFDEQIGIAKYLSAIIELTSV